MTTNQQPKNIFECINLNIVDLSQEVLALRQITEKNSERVDKMSDDIKAINDKLDTIIMTLYPPLNSEPNAPGAE